MIQKLPILLEGNPILRIPCTPVKYVHKEDMDLALSMTKTMIHANGIGLSAPQIGKSIQLIVVDTTYVEPGGTSAIMFNPEIIESEGEVTSLEGCLSLPDKLVKVKRKEKIKVRYLNIQNQPIERKFTGVAAIAIQHELMHLQGKILSDYIDNGEL
jgi:peptide deformylase